jgi:hypothetical protein
MLRQELGDGLQVDELLKWTLDQEHGRERGECEEGAWLPRTLQRNSR